MLLHSDSYSQRIQDTSLTTYSCIKQYDIVADGFYGYPFFMGVLLKKFLSDTLHLTKVRNFNHVGLKMEYMFWQQIGIGAEYTYALVTGIARHGVYGKSYIIGISRRRILLRFNYHYNITEKWDQYLTAGLGYANTQVFTNYPGIKPETVKIPPVAFRVGIGVRYFIKENFGINAEAGLGGPLIQLGLSFKI